MIGSCQFNSKQESARENIMPEISVIVPVYNTEKHLMRCVKSIVDQTYTDFELILVDDGSSDGSPKICDEWTERDCRIHVTHKKNGGASSARNAGLAIAKGKWVFFSDSDDWIDNKALETLYGMVNEYGVSMAIGGIQVVEENIDRNAALNENIYMLSRENLLDRFFRVNGEPDTHSICATLIRRDILEDYHFIEGKMNEDVEACYYLARKCEGAVYTSKPVYFYFKNVEGVTNSGFSKKKLDLLDVWDIVQKQVLQYTPEYAYACEMNCKRARFTLLTQMYMNGYDHNDPYMRETKQRLKKEVRASFFDLMRWKMPINRKIALIAFLFVP